MFYRVNNTTQWNRKYVSLFVFLFIFIIPVQAHDVAGELENMSASDAALVYLGLGFTHIIPLGLDHILFVLSLYLLNPRLKPVLLQATTFTLAHSVTLALSVYKVFELPGNLVEPAIALSILFVALQNIFSKKINATRIGLVFLFGLLHGMGFAGALDNIGLPENSFLASLLFFNIGVEFGQLAIILAAFLVFGKWFGDKPYFKKRIVIPVSIVIAIIATYWTIERLI